MMPKTKVAVTLNSGLLDELDELIARRQFPNRSQAIETALAEKLARLARRRLALEAAKLDPREEKALAEEGLGADLRAWPEY
jgi:Arc/MetJ-type ribon-helix-helix transcriptional regulator